MHKCLALAFLVALAINFSSAATTMWPEYETTQVAAKKNWVVLEDAQPDELVKVTIGLHLRNTEVFTSMLLDVSDPRSKNYGKYKTQKEIYQLTSPSIESVSAVYDWLESANPISIEVRNNGGFISAIYPVSTARSLFSGDHSKIIFQKFYHKNNPTKTVVRCATPVYIPQSLQSTIQLIEGVNDFPYLNIKSTKRTSHTSSSKWSIITGDGAAVVHVDVNTADYSQVAVTVTQGNVSQTQTQTLSASGLASIPFQFSSLANYVNLDVTVTQQDRQTGQITNIPTNYLFDVFPSPFITPAVANSLYFIPPGTKSTNISNSQAVAEFDEQYYSPSDLSSFSQLMGVPTPNVTVFGNNDPSKPGGESTLDIEWITAIGVGVPTYFWYVKEGFLLAWAISVSESPNPPLVHSISYGEPEALIKHSLLTRLNQEFQLLGTRGISIISTSGDLGSSDGTPDCAKDVPDFPSSSPWTTSLGATYISQTVATPVCTNNNVYGIPIVCDALSELPCAQDAGSGFTTGGGFSAKFARPSYQDAAVEAYINSAELPPSSYFNSSGRGFNDVGALGYHILAYQSGKLDITGGTSASGPIFAGILALLNDIQLNAGKPPLGFINPWLYQTADIYPQAFNPVLSGDNKCRESGQQCCENGFVAQRGWNPLTGLGTPVFPLLADALP